MSITFTGDILAHARDRGVSLSADDVAAINLNINAVATFEGGSLSFDLGGRPADLGEVVEGMSRGYGKLIEKPVTTSTPASSIPAGSNSTERAILINQAAKAGAASAKREQAVKLAEIFGNPWTPDRPNRSNQGFILNHNPALAARLKQQAGIRS